jgi:hypothetical protein
LLLAALFCPAALWSEKSAMAAEPAGAPVVVELFTSQGCSSCPPADALLGELAARADVLPLGFHVTYWDRLGWPDSFGLEDATRRQEAYAATLGNDRLYTPQMVIGGRIDVVGSDRHRVLQAIDLLAEHVGSGPALSLDDEAIAIGAGPAAPATVWLVAFDRLEEVAIERGENRGRSIAYYHPVREPSALGRWQGEALTLEAPLDRLAARGHEGVAVLLQRDADGLILAAARRDLARR